MYATPNIASSRWVESLWWLLLGILAFAGILMSDGWEIGVAYLMICLAAIWPGRLWVQRGFGGVPILSVYGVLHVQYYALPMLGDNYNVRLYSPDDIFMAGVTVTLFLSAATFAWWIVMRRPVGSRVGTPRQSLLTDRETVVTCLVGLIVALVFQVLLIQGGLQWMGSAFGVVRSISFSVTFVSSFLMGVLLAENKLRGKLRSYAFFLFVLTLLLSLHSLFLILGMILVATLILGYFIAGRRLPVVAIAVVMPFMMLLHAGKGEMRDQYWYGDAKVSSVLDLPGFYLEWMGRGWSAMSEGREEQSLIDRASLLQMLLQAQVRTPSEIDFLRGETYALLPPMLVPRFIIKDKPTSQEAMNMLNMRYGLVHLNAEGNVNASISWGVIAEAYVNFAIPGVIGVGLFMGTLIGFLERQTVNRYALSLPVLLGIVTMVTLVNIELDLTYLATILFQSFIALTLVYFAIEYRVKRKRKGSQAGLADKRLSLNNYKPRRVDRRP